MEKIKSYIEQIGEWAKKSNRRSLLVIAVEQHEEDKDLVDLDFSLKGNSGVLALVIKNIAQNDDDFRFLLNRIEEMSEPSSNSSN